MPRTRWMIVATALLATGACAPVTMSGPGVQLGFAPGQRLHLQSAMCSPAATQQWGSPLSLSRSASPFAFKRQIERLQARFQLGAQQLRSQPEAWKHLASGDC